MLREVFLILLTWTPHLAADCVIRGICHSISSANKAPCDVSQDDRSTVQLDAQAPAFQKLLRFCPTVFEDNSEFCCDQEQLTMLADDMTRLHSIFGSCPSCFHNMAHMFCQATCSPKQDEFISVGKSLVSPDGKKYVDTMEHFILRSYVEGTFSSCKDVSFLGTTAISAICGSGTCTVDSWLNYVGTKNINIRIPINTVYKMEQDNSTRALHVTATQCDKEYLPGIPSCSIETCPMNNTMEFMYTNVGEEVCRIYGIGCSQVFFVVVCILLTGVVAFIGYRIYSECCKKRNLNKSSVTIDPLSLDDSASVRRLPGVIATGELVKQAIQKFCKDYGVFIANNTSKVLLSSIFVILLLAIGLGSAKFAEDPLDLWSAPNSLARQKEAQFRVSFRPPYKIVQVTLHSSNEDLLPDERPLRGPIFSVENLAEVFELEKKLREVVSSDGKVKLDNICARPLGEDCLIMGVTNYFQNDRDFFRYLSSGQESMSWSDFYYEKYNKFPSKNFSRILPPTESPDYFAPNEMNAMAYERQVYSCLQNPLQLESSVGFSCFGSYGGPALAVYTFGHPKFHYVKAQSTTITIGLEAGKVPKDAEKIRKWEESFIEMMENYVPKVANLTVSWMTDASIPAEMNRQTEKDVMYFAIGAAFTVIFVAFFLGKYFIIDSKLVSVFVHTKLTVGFFGVICAFISCMSSVSVISLYGLEPPKSAVLVMVLIIISVSVNATFIYVKVYHELRQNQPDADYAETIGKMTESSMSSCLITATTGVLIFFIGGMTTMPAIRSLSILSGMAVFWQFVFHNTFWLPILCIDVSRERNGTTEMGCYKLQHPRNAELQLYDSSLSEFFKNKYSLFLMNPWVKVSIMILMCATFTGSFTSAFFIDVGFDERLAFADNSYLNRYYNHLNEYMNVGPPVYFIFDGEVDLHKPEVQNLICSLPTCARRSAGTLLSIAGKKSQNTSLEGPAENWMNSYLQWMDRSSFCCQLLKNDTSVMCPEQWKGTENCVSCMELDSVANSHLKRTLEYRRPSEKPFYKFLPIFLTDKPGKMCPHGGLGRFDGSIDFSPEGRIRRFHIKSNFKKLRIGQSSDFIYAMRTSQAFAERLKNTTDNLFDVSVYSTWFVYYEQYSTIVHTMLAQLMLILIIIFISLVVLLGIDIFSACIGVLVEFSFIVHMFGVLWMFSIQLNAVSVTNVTMSVVISLEFVIHVLKDYCSSTGSRTQKAVHAVAHTGCIVFQGLFMCLTFSTLPLLFCHSRVITYYYCRVLLCTAALCTLHSLLYLPVLLSLGGYNRKNSRGNGAESSTFEESRPICLELSEITNEETARTTLTTAL